MITTYAAVCCDGWLIRAELYAPRFNLLTALGYMPPLDILLETARMRMGLRLIGISIKAFFTFSDMVSEKPLTLREFMADVVARISPQLARVTR